MHVWEVFKIDFIGRKDVLPFYKIALGSLKIALGSLILPFALLSKQAHTSRYLIFTNLVYDQKLLHGDLRILMTGEQNQEFDVICCQLKFYMSVLLKVSGLLPLLALY